jgi:hypothetical protein
VKKLQRPLRSGQQISAEQKRLEEAMAVMRKFVPASRSLFEKAEKGEPWAVHQLLSTVRYGVELLNQIAAEETANR